MTTIASPCRKICTLDAGRSFCLSCGRTLDEIAGWSRFTEAERGRIMGELPARLRARQHQAQQQQ